MNVCMCVVGCITHHDDKGSLANGIDSNRIDGQFNSVQFSPIESERRLDWVRLD